MTVVGQSTLVVVRPGPTRLSAFPCRARSPGPGPMASSARVFRTGGGTAPAPHAATTATRSRSTRQQTASPGHPWRKTSTTSSRSRPGAASVSAPPPLPSRKPLNPHRVSVDATPRDHTCCVLLHAARDRRRTHSRPRRWTEERSTDRPGSVHAPSG